MQSAATSALHAKNWETGALRAGLRTATARCCVHRSHPSFWLPGRAASTRASCCSGPRPVRKRSNCRARAKSEWAAAAWTRSVRCRGGGQKQHLSFAAFRQWRGVGTASDPVAQQGDAQVHQRRSGERCRDWEFGQATATPWGSHVAAPVSHHRLVVQACCGRTWKINCHILTASLGLNPQGCCASIHRGISYFA